MLEYDELKVEFEGYEPELKELAGALDLDNLKTEIAKLEEQSAQPDFWNDVENSQKISQKIGEDKNIVQSYEKLRESYDDVMTMLELAQEEDDESMLPEIQELAKHFRTELESQKLATLLSGEFDHNNAILTFHAGAGGTEAQDWVEMLYRMYNHWAEQHGMKVTVLDYLDGEEAGIKAKTRLRWTFTVQAVRAVRRSTRHPPLFVSHISLQASCAPARQSVHSIRTENMLCVC